MSSAPVKRIWKAASGLHSALYRRSGGKFAGSLANLPILLVTTYGRKSGRPTTNPVVYLKDGPDYLVSATNGGSGSHPDWYLNLKANPHARIQVGTQALNVEAYIAEGDERTRLYELFKAASSNFVKYEKGTSRVLPVIRLTPGTTAGT